MKYDFAIVGAGIMGLAHAYALARRGLRVIVFERNARAQGASVRNFGMLWPIGQPPGSDFELALRSRSIWLEVLHRAQIWHDPCGSFHLAYHEDEQTVLQEFIAAAGQQGYDCGWCPPADVFRKAPYVRQERLRGGMWSSTEVCVDPREVLAELPRWLQQTYQVQFQFNSLVTHFDQPRLWAAGREWTAEYLLVCAGDDFQTLYPEEFANSGLFRVKLQMMRSRPMGSEVRLGPMLAAGLTLCHYKAFQACPSLPTLRDRFARELPEYLRYGIHVMASQNAQGEIVIGDSHEYDEQISPFDKPAIDELILSYLRRFLNVPQLDIASRWHGIYAGHPSQLCWTARPAPGVLIVASPSGRGMTMSFGVAEHNIQVLLGEI